MTRPFPTTTTRLAITLVLVALVRPATSARAEPLTVQAAAESAVRNHPSVAAAVREVAAARSDLRGAGGPFDTVLSATLGHRHETTPLDAASRLAVGASSMDVETTSYSFGVDKTLRFGTQVGGSVELSRVGTSGPGDAVGRATVLATAIQPLLLGRGEEVVAVEERVGEHVVEVTREVALQVAEAQATAAALGYWALVAARDQVRIEQEAERRAQRVADEVEVLIAADERPAADRVQLSAWVAERTAGRMAAEGAVAQARTALRSAMGLEPAEPTEIELPADPMPRIDARSIPARAAWAALADAAPLQRPAYRALLASAAGIRTRLEAARRSGEPRLDLGASLGYQGLAEGSGGEPFVTPFAAGVEGVLGEVTLTFSLPVERTAADAEAAALAARLEQLTFATKAAELAIRADMIQALDGLATAVSQLEIQDRATALVAEAVEAEHEKLRAGLSTVLDVLLTQDRLRAASLAQVQARLAVADAILAVRVAAGQVTADRGESAPPEILPLATLPEWASNAGEGAP